MSIRITQHRLQVVEPQPDLSEVRVSNQVLQFVTNVPDLSEIRISNHVVQFIETVDLTEQINAGGSDTVTFAETVICDNFEAPRPATETISITDNGDATAVFNVSASDSVTLTEGQRFLLNGALCLGAADTSTFMELATISDLNEVELTASDAPTFMDVAEDIGDLNVVIARALDVFGYTESNTCAFTIYAEAEDDLSTLVFDFQPDPFDNDPNFDPDAAGAISFNPVRVAGITESAILSAPDNAGNRDSLDVNESNTCYIIRGDARDLSASDICTFEESTAFGVEDTTSDLVDFDESATCEFVCPTRDALEITEVASLDIKRNASGGDTLELRENVFIQCIPAEGDIRDKIAESYDYPDAVQPADGIQLISPATGTILDQLLLPSPNFGNNYRLTVTRVNTESRGGTLLVFTDPECWPITETLQLSISNMKSEVGKALLTWFEEHLGEEIRLIDYEGRAWVGVITTPDDPIVEDSRNRWTGSFEFEGELVDV